MIVTHSNKFLKPESTVTGLVKSEHLEVPANLVCSNHVRKAKKYWAHPHCAKYYREAKELAEQANSENKADNNFPNFLDKYCKQMFLKTKDGFIIHTPLHSLAFLDEISTCIKDLYFNEGHNSFDYFPHQIAPAGLSLANRGELALKNYGRFRMKRVYIPKKPPLNNINLDENRQYVFFEGNVENANLNASFISAGLPSLTAVGGIVQLLEVELKEDSIPFAFGVRNGDISRSGKKGVDFRHKKAVPKLECTEINGYFEFCIVLDVTDFKKKSADKVKSRVLKKKLTKIEDCLLKVRRLAGGPIFNCKVSRKIETNYAFVVKDEESIDIANHTENPVHYIIKNNLTLITAGYALLEKPKERKNVRNSNLNDKEHLHSFTEPLFCSVSFSNVLNEKSFFKREIGDNYTAYI